MEFNISRLFYAADDDCISYQLVTSLISQVHLRRLWWGIIRPFSSFLAFTFTNICWILIQEVSETTALISYGRTRHTIWGYTQQERSAIDTPVGIDNVVSSHDPVFGDLEGSYFLNDDLSPFTSEGVNRTINDDSTYSMRMDNYQCSCNDSPSSDKTSDISPLSFSPFSPTYFYTNNYKSSNLNRVSIPYI